MVDNITYVMLFARDVERDVAQAYVLGEFHIAYREAIVVGRDPSQAPVQLISRDDAVWMTRLGQRSGLSAAPALDRPREWARSGVCRGVYEGYEA